MAYKTPYDLETTLFGAFNEQMVDSKEESIEILNEVLDTPERRAAFEQALTSLILDTSLTFVQKLHEYIHHNFVNDEDEAKRFFQHIWETSTHKPWPES